MNLLKEINYSLKVGPSASQNPVGMSILSVAIEDDRVTETVSLELNFNLKELCMSPLLVKSRIILINLICKLTS